MFLFGKRQRTNIKFLSFSMVFLLISGKSYSKKIDEIMQQDQNGLIASQQAQIKVEHLDEKKVVLVEQFRQVLREQQLSDKYNQLLKKQIGQLEVALLDIQDKQTQLRATRMTLVPLMEEMVDSLALMITADAPFLLTERQTRIDNLRRRLVDASLTESEKILSVLDAYQVELSFGYTTESWQGKLDGNLVNYVRIGRLGFYYFTPDELSAGVWNRGWQPLAIDWVPEIKKASEVSAGDQIPSLLKLPAMHVEVQ
ncbi:DUF3450 domain-containing protein [Vibrio harveyi]|uniref:DUF3450 domain-containing protein n=1 Tax=Vibrio harveyi TaxID=669 RepID=UPI00131BD396|nr:DUF3450 domain-containing protein [Vibrio harveyi]